MAECLLASGTHNFRKKIGKIIFNFKFRNGGRQRDSGNFVDARALLGKKKIPLLSCFYVYRAMQ